MLLLLVAVARAGYLGLFRGSALRQAANAQQVQTAPIPAPRGEITDRNGVVLALSQPADVIIRRPDPDHQDLQASADGRRQARAAARHVEVRDADGSDQAEHRLHQARHRLADGSATEISALIINGIYPPVPSRAPRLPARNRGGTGDRLDGRQRSRAARARGCVQQAACGHQRHATQRARRAGQADLRHDRQGDGARQEPRADDLGAAAI